MVNSMNALRAFTSGLTLRLFANDYTPDEATVDAGVFAEVNGGGYAAERLSDAEWTIRETEAEHPLVKFVFSGRAGKCYGYYLTRSDGSLAGAERFRKPYNVEGEWDTIDVAPVVEWRG